MTSSRSRGWRCVFSLVIHWISIGTPWSSLSPTKRATQKTNEMDPKACLEILAKRRDDLTLNQLSNKCDHSHSSAYTQSLPGVTCADINGGPVSTEQDEKFKNILSSYTNLELANLFSTLQGERCQIYKEFDQFLKKLIDDCDIASYPHVCSEITGLFSIISHKILVIKSLFEDRKLNDFASLISEIQEREKEKLTHTAAMHLEVIRTSFPLMTHQLGPTVVNHMDDLKMKLNKIESEITGLMDDFQCTKCELTE